MGTISRAYDSFCTEQFPLPTQKQVAHLEKRIGVTFPKSYRAYILGFNGGYFSEPRIAPPTADCPIDRLTFMHGIGASDRTAELASSEELAIFDDNDPPQVIPIGYTLMGNLILIVTHPEGRGSIVLKKAFSDESFLLAEDIEEFFNLLHKAPEED